MTLLSRLLGDRTRRGKLETLIENIDFDNVYTIAKEREPSLRTPTAISLALLVVVGKFCRELQNTIAKLNETMRASKRSKAPYDVVAYEAAAFFHYALMREYPSPETDEDEGEERHGDDPYFDALREAAQLTGGLVNDAAKFDVPPGMFNARMIRYGVLTGTMEAELREFELLLSASIEAGKPVKEGSISLDLALGVALKLETLAFYSTMIPALRETCRRLYAYQWDE
jgi:hypothetical protein